VKHKAFSVSVDSAVGFLVEVIPHDLLLDIMETEIFNAMGQEWFPDFIRLLVGAVPIFDEAAQINDFRIPIAFIVFQIDFGLPHFTQF
jgi:hypothetical protein